MPWNITESTEIPVVLTFCCGLPPKTNNTLLYSTPPPPLSPLRLCLFALSRGLHQFFYRNRRWSSRSPAINQRGKQRQEENKEEEDPVDALNEKLRTEAYALL
jgi:hypothetical protein